MGAHLSGGAGDGRAVYSHPLSSCTAIAMYRPIADYALIGDTQSAALVGSNASIDFLCLPRFDSPAVFLRLLDDHNGGFCSVALRGTRSRARRYLGDTNILETTLRGTGGRLTITDFMPVKTIPEKRPNGQEVEAFHRVVRLLRCEEGEVECEIAVRPTFDYAGKKVEALSRGAERALYMGRDGALHVQTPAKIEYRDDTLICKLRLRRGEERALVLTWAELPHDVKPATLKQLKSELRHTREFWEKWSKTCSDQGEYHATVLRSALALKLLVYEPTGAIVAAPTTSLPEHIGGPRNWDYRFTWLRDSSLTLVTLMNLGYFGEAHDFFHFLRRNLHANAANFQIMYRPDGGENVPEMTLDHLDGYRHSRPVRIGNGAAHQEQLGIYGELLHSTFLYWAHHGFEHRVESFRRDFWPMVKHVADFVVDHWRDKDSGIWESRGEPRDYTHSKGMCWVALDRAIKLAKMRLPGEDVSRWERERERVGRDLELRAYHPKVGAYTQAYGETAMDASILRLPLQHVLDARSERMRSTIQAIERKLMRNGLVYRYRQAESDDGIEGQEGTFTACAFWLVENYAIQGRLRHAEELFRHITSFANDLGLMSEEIDAGNGEQLGNFPQAFTHIALINAAVRLAAARRGDIPGTQKLMPHGGRDAGVNEHGKRPAPKRPRVAA